MAEVHKLFVGGGFDDWFTHIVEDYEAAYAKLNPTFKCKYFSWTDIREIGELVRGLPVDAHLTIVGHSYGADSAFYGMNVGRTVDVLISIDPVGRLTSMGCCASRSKGLGERARRADRGASHER